MDDSELNPNTKKLREQEQMQREAIEKEKQENLYKQMEMELASSLPKILINPGHGPEEQDIFLFDELVNVVKPYQIEGIQFLWENIVWMRDIEGCILADSMGLGMSLLTSYVNFS